MAENVRDFANLPDFNPLVAILDIAAQNKYIHPEGALSQADMRKLVTDYKDGKIEWKPLR